MKNVLKIILKPIVLWASKAAFKLLFNFIDRNKDGYIDQDEIKKTIKEIESYIKQLKK